MKGLVTLLLCGAAFVAGCGVQGPVLGSERTYLFNAYDALAPPGQEVALRARLLAGGLLRSQPGHVMRFRRDGRLYGAAVTDDDGAAEVSFTPKQPGEYVFTAELAPSGFPKAPPAPTRLVVACRPAETPLLIVDLDKTLVASGFQTVLLGDPAAMPDSPRVMQRLAEKYTVTYLTHRPDVFGPKSKSWLRAQGYPLAPVLLSDFRGFLRGSEDFKSSVLSDLRRRFTNIRIGIGDKISDARAYHQNGIRAFLIIQPDKVRTAEGLKKLAAAIEQGLPAPVQVVTEWKQIDQAVFGGASFPRDRMLQRLRALAKEKSQPPAGASNRPTETQTGGAR